MTSGKIRTGRVLLGVDEIESASDSVWISGNRESAKSCIFVPGTAVAGVTSGFGVIFSEVDNAGTTAIQVFDNLGNSLGAFAASPLASGFSFLGVFYDDGTTPIGRARITTGNSPLGALLTDAPPTRDVVVMDDFIFGNPVANVPEPGTLGLFATGFVSAFLLRRRIIR